MLIRPCDDCFRRQAMVLTAISLNYWLILFAPGSRRVVGRPFVCRAMMLTRQLPSQAGAVHLHPDGADLFRHGAPRGGENGLGFLWMCGQNSMWFLWMFGIGHISNRTTETMGITEAPRRLFRHAWVLWPSGFVTSSELTFRWLIVVNNS